MDVSIMNMIEQYLLFFAKALTVLLAVICVLALSSRNKDTPSPKPRIKVLNHNFLQHLQQTSKSLSKYKGFNSLAKKYKKQLKEVSDLESKLFILEFDGDIKASQIDTLRHEIDMVLSLATSNDRVLIKLTSRGGTITGYGLAASQVKRFRDAHIPLTISIDQIAASGGYLIASLANDIIAAPFACIGSIGVVFELPNINKLLHKHGIEYTQVTAGKHKRTLSLLGKNTPEGEKKVKEDIDIAHELFKDYVTQYRELNTDEIATGETWPALVAQTKGLVDHIQTSDEFIVEAMQSSLILSVYTKDKPKLMQLIRDKLSTALQHLE